MPRRGGGKLSVRGDQGRALGHGHGEVQAVVCRLVQVEGDGVSGGRVVGGGPEPDGRGQNGIQGTARQFSGELARAG